MATEEKNRPADATIIELLEAGEPEGLRVLIRVHGATVRGVLRHRFRDVLAEIELEEIFWLACEAVWLRFSTFDSRRGCLRNWFLTVARNQALKVLRVRRAAPLLLHGELLGVLIAEEQVPHVGHFDRSLLRHPFWRTILSECRRLPFIERSILKADWAAGGTADSAMLADDLGITVNNVRVRRCRWKAKIIRALDRAGFIVSADRGRVVVLPSGIRLAVA